MKLIWARLDGRDGHTVGRELLRKLVGEMPEIAVTDQGKPYFVNYPLHFSISHSKNHAFCAVSKKNIGIDAEETDRPIDPRLGQRYLSETEKARLQNAADPRDALLRLWVLKESCAKLTGRGWGNYLKSTDFNPEDPRIRIIDGCYVAVLEDNEASHLRTMSF